MHRNIAIPFVKRGTMIAWWWKKPPENPDKIRQRKANKRLNWDLMAFSEMFYWFWSHENVGQTVGGQKKYCSIMLPLGVKYNFYSYNEWAKKSKF